ncbi:MAG TPA: crossover junction endodeoxyribonuclease RuvC [Actinobacteria bacterium]|jgi:crossover junction endodeoxyribonuclease RuvC|nr:crossover junction endodeoxyribonuclease RuvC [Actinomycetota bacterium]
MDLKNKRILGIDPGLETTGVSVIDISDSSSYKIIFCDCIITSKNKKIPQRLSEIYEGISEVIQKCEPSCLAIEELFFAANAKTAMNVGQARGTVLLAAFLNNMEIYEYTPLEVKQAITGYGRASKEQIKYMIKVILKIKENSFVPKKDDAWDSLAIAVCHANSSNFYKKIKKAF